MRENRTYNHLIYIYNVCVFVSEQEDKIKRHTACEYLCQKICQTECHKEVLHGAYVSINY